MSLAKVKLAHALFDQKWSEARRRDKIKLSCGKGCSACCSEPLYVNESEVELILQSVPIEEREGVVERVKQWAFRAESTGLLRQPEPDALTWLSAQIVCPLLKDGVCLVYQNRPLSCRSHATCGDPAHCGDLTKRREQIYVWPNELVAHCALLIQQQAGRNDHLGVFLAERLLGKSIYSAGRVDVDVEKKTIVRR